MPIVNITIDVAGQIGVNPRRVKIATTDDLATITAAGYLNSQYLPSAIEKTDIFDIIYNYDTQTKLGTYGQFLVVFNKTIITLTPSGAGGDVLLPVVSGNFSVFNGTTGQIKDSGYLPSNAAKTTVVMANSATTISYIPTFTDTAGTITNAVGGTSIANSAIQSGVSTGGTTGTFRAMSPNATAGSISLTATNNAGNFANVITHASMGQATTFQLPDPGASAARVALTPNSNLVANNLISALTTTTVGDSGFKIIANLTDVWAGGSTSHTFTATGLTASSIVSCSLASSANTVAFKAVPGTNNLAVTFSADPGVGTQLSFIATSVATP